MEATKIHNLAYTCLLAIFMEVISWYVYGFSFIQALGLENKHINTVLIAVNSHYKVFNSQLIYKLITLLFLFPGLLFAVNDYLKHYNKVTTFLLLSIGLTIYLFPLSGGWYLLCSVSGFMCISVALCRINMGPQVSNSEDPFNDIEESFPQEERLITNQYSVNLPMYYYLKNKEGRLEKRNGWLNFTSIFRGCLICGSPGAGKSFCVLEPMMKQLINKGFCMICYDFKYPTLSRKVYNYFQNALNHGAYAKINPDVTPRYYQINLDNPAYSNRCNPINPTLLKDDTDSMNVAINVMLALNPEWRRTADFFANSAMNIYSAILLYLRTVESGKYCTFPHANELLSVELDRLLPILLSKKQLENITKPFQNAFINGATEQIEGQIASAQIPLARLTTENIYYIYTSDDFTLDINDPYEPKVVCVANNPKKVEAYATPLSLLFYQAIQQVNQQNKWPCCLSFDEFPTLYLANIDRTVNTARSNLVAVLLAFQDNSQIARDYGEAQAKVVVSTPGNIICGQVQNETADIITKYFGKKIQNRASHSVSESGVSYSVSDQMEDMFPVSKIVSLSQGEMIGKIADTHQQPIKHKLFHCKIDTDKMDMDESYFQEIPIITHFPKEKAPQIYVDEWFQEFSERFYNPDIDKMMQIIMSKADETNVYHFSENDFNITPFSASQATKNLILHKFNIDIQTCSDYQKVINRFLNFTIGQFLNLGFLDNTGCKNQYYVMIWMRAYVRENYYKVKKDIADLVDRTEQILLSNPETIKLYRTSYLKQLDSEFNTYDDEERSDEECVLLDETNLID